MCGIAGVLHRSGDKLDPDVLVRMTRSLVHRGPDGEGYFLNGPRPGSWLEAGDAVSVRACIEGGRGDVGLGHRRLSIIDLSTGQQPLANEDGTVWVTFNGEIYNFHSLVAELEAKGHRFRTRSDTEVIVHAWEEWGQEAVKRFRGMFAFALWDERQQKLWIARDRVGKKPLYYLLDEDRLVFASEIKAILEMPGVSRDLDLEALSDYLSLLYIPSPKTIFRSIRKLPAAHQLVVSRDRTELSAYWDLPFMETHTASAERMIEELLGRLEEATKLRMISDVPLGAFLSGGVDSSAVVAMMARASAQPVRTNSISFSVRKYDEIEYARQVAKLYGTDHHEFHVTPEAVRAIEKLAWHYDEPFADSSAVPTYYVSQTARQRVTVALSGDGGDENFAGYRRYAFDLRENFVRGLVPAFLRRPVFRALGRLYPKADYLPQVFRGKAFLSNLARDPVDAYFFSVSAFDDNEKQRVLGADVARQLGDYRTADLFRDVYQRAPARDHLSRIQYLDIKTYLCEDILTKVDRAAMAVSLEVRCPLLDHVFMEYAAGIPSELKLSGSAGKRIFKQALKKHLPDDILYRPKMGFGVPVPEWLRGDLKNYARELVLEGDATRRYLSRPSVERLWREHASGLRNRATELWVIMMLNLWHRRFVEG
ncbi:MAG: asparagine synthase (glutamine-hydrolyzing) [Candidatus Rokuibacteriota bacterium]|nr:MAG: asparagine synthase (glutamine-hydrolyzing) [Candidatus Rokubacteria bacterium]